MMVHVAADRLAVHYRGAPLLQKIHLQLPAGQMLALVGPSGAGKSTLLKVFNRLLELDPRYSISGEVRIGQQSIYAPGTDVVDLRKRVGMLLQQPTLFPLSIFDNVAFALREGQDARQQVERRLRQVGLWDALHKRLRRPAQSLSGGQAQRLCLARALAAEPEVLLLDEPTSALDPGSRREIEDLLGGLKGRITMLLVTHNMQQAQSLADQTALVAHGTLQEQLPTPLFFSPNSQDRRFSFLRAAYAEEAT